jgi:hypothetical protein
MNNPGAFAIGDIGIAAAGTLSGPWISTLQGLKGLTLQARLALGTAGTKISAYIQTSFDQGATPCDIACFTFTNLSAVKGFNLSALTPRTEFVPTDGALADDTMLDGPLGDYIRYKVVSTGIYSGGTLLSLRGVAR